MATFKAVVHLGFQSAKAAESSASFNCAKQISGKTPQRVARRRVCDSRAEERIALGKPEYSYRKVSLCFEGGEVEYTNTHGCIAW